MRTKLILLLLLYTKLTQAQRIPAYDSISTAQQDYPCVAQALDDGTVLMAAVSRPWLLNGMGKLIVVRMDMDGNPIYHNTIELSEISINNVGGIFKTGVNQYTLFCTFDTTSPNFNNRPTHFGFMNIDSFYKIQHVKYIFPNYISSIAHSGIYDIRVKMIKKGLFFGTLGVADTTINSPYIINFDINTDSSTITYKWDTLNYIKHEDGRISEWSFKQILPMDFEWIYDTYLLKALRPAFITGNTIALIDNDSLFWRPLYTNSILPDIRDSLNNTQRHLFNYQWRKNIRYFKDSLLLISGPGRYECEQNFCIDTLYQHKPNQSVIALIPLTSNALRQSHNAPYRFTFVEDIREAFYDTTASAESTMFRLYGDYYSSAYMQCLDFKDENKIYYGRQIGDVVNLQLPYSAFPSILLISQFDSTLQKKWERRIVTRNREGIVSVNATHDGGVLLITRSSVGPQNDPQFPGPVHLYDIAVYKFNEHGVITSYKKVQSDKPNHSHTLYPNPAKDVVRIKGDSHIHSIAVWDSQGKQYSCDYDIEKQAFTIEHLPKGIYYVQLFDTNSQLINVVKVARE